MSELCYLSRSAWYAAPRRGLGEAEQVPQGKPVFVSQAGHGGFNIANCVKGAPAAGGEANRVGVLNVQVVFNQARLAQSANQFEKAFEFVRIIFGLVRIGVHTLKATQPVRKNNS